MVFKVANKFSIFVVILFLCSQLIIAAVPDNVQNIFVNNTCLNCHSGNNPQGGLALDDANTSEESMVNVIANCSINNEAIVDTNSASSSILTQKLSSQNPNCGDVMPPNGNLISSTDLVTISDWIVSIGSAGQFGLISFSENTVSVNESEGIFLMTVKRELGLQGEVSVDFTVDSLINDNASPELDFEAQTGTLIFASGEAAKDISISINDDDIFEGTETFSISLSNVTNGAALSSQSQAKIEIIDDETNDIPGTFFFAKQSYSLNENIAEVEIKINRSFGANSDVTVELRSLDGSALSGSDFQTINEILVFDEGVKEQSITLIIIDDVDVESTEQFKLELSNPTNGALLSTVFQANIIINDNDGNTGSDGSGGTNGDTNPNIETPQDEVEFEAAGSISYTLLLLLFLAFLKHYYLPTKLIYSKSKNT